MGSGRVGRWEIVGLLVMGAGGALACSGPPETGPPSLTGRLTAPDGRPVIHAQVSLGSPLEFTDADGRFELLDVDPAGAEPVRVTAPGNALGWPGFHTVRGEFPVRLASSGRTEVELVLRVDPPVERRVIFAHPPTGSAVRIRMASQELESWARVERDCTLQAPAGEVELGLWTDVGAVWTRRVDASTETRVDLRFGTLRARCADAAHTAWHVESVVPMDGGKVDFWTRIDSEPVDLVALPAGAYRLSSGDVTTTVEVPAEGVVEVELAP